MGAASEGPRARPGLGRATLIMGTGTSLSRVTGFIRIAVIAWAIGGAESKLPDTYQLANTLPNIVYQLILGEVLVTVFVPVFVEYLSKKGAEETRKLSSTMLALAFVVSALVSLATVIAAPWLIKIYSFRLSGADRAAQEAVGTFFLRLFMPQMVFYATGMVLTGLLNANRRFAAPMFAPILNNLTVIATFIAFRTIHGAETPTLVNLATSDKLLLGLGTTAGVVAMTLAYLPSVFRLSSPFRLKDVDLRHPALRKIRSLAKWAFAYVIVNQIGLLVVKALANGRQGGVAAYDTSFILYSLPYGIVAVSVFTALVPSLSESFVNKDMSSFRNDFTLGLRMTSFVVMPAAAGLVALAHPLMRVFLEHGVFSAASTDLFADTFALMAIGLAAYAAFQQIMRAFVSMQDTKTPWIANSVGVAVNIATAIPLFFVLEVPGLGLSHALSYIAALFAGAWLLSRRVGGLGGRALAAWHLKLMLASIATGSVAWAVARVIGSSVDLTELWGQVLQVTTAIAGGTLTFLAAAALLRFDELAMLQRMVRRAIRRAR